MSSVSWKSARLKRYFCYERNRNYFSVRAIKSDSSQIPHNSTLSPCNASQSGTPLAGLLSRHAHHWIHTILDQHLTANHNLQNSTAHETDKKITWQTHGSAVPRDVQQGSTNGCHEQGCTWPKHWQSSGDEMTSPPTCSRNMSTWLTRGANSSITEMDHWWDDWQQTQRGQPL